MRLTSIISGGAAGAERGALRAAIDLDLGYGGWRWCEDDVPEVYTSRMRPAVSRAMQRRLNVQDSDATLFIMRPGSKEMKFIVDACRAMHKPAKTLVINGRHTAGDALLAWIHDRNVSILNVVGDAGEDETRDALVWMLDDRAMPTRSLPCSPFGRITPVEFDTTNGFIPSTQTWQLGDDGSIAKYTIGVDGVVYTQPVRQGVATLSQDTPTEKSGDACSSQRIVSDGANPSPDTDV